MPFMSWPKGGIPPSVMFVGTKPWSKLANPGVADALNGGIRTNEPLAFCAQNSWYLTGMPDAAVMSGLGVDGAARA